MLLTADWVVPVSRRPLRDGAVLVRDDHIVAVGLADELAASYPDEQRVDSEWLRAHARPRQRAHSPWALGGRRAVRADALHRVAPADRAGDAFVVRGRLRGFHSDRRSEMPASGRHGRRRHLLRSARRSRPQRGWVWAAPSSSRFSASLPMSSPIASPSSASIRTATGGREFVPGCRRTRCIRRGPRFSKPWRSLHARRPRPWRFMSPRPSTRPTSCATVPVGSLLWQPSSHTGSDPPAPHRWPTSTDSASLDGATAIHLCQTWPADVRRLAATVRGAVTCPRSNAWLHNGLAPVEQLLRHGVPVGIGTDSLASTPDLDLFEEARALREHLPGLSPRTHIEMLTVQGALALGVEDRFGVLEPGMQADLAAFALPDTDDPEAALLERGGSPDACRDCRGRRVACPRRGAGGRHRRRGAGRRRGAPARRPSTRVDGARSPLRRRSAHRRPAVGAPHALRARAGMVLRARSISRRSRTCPANTLPLPARPSSSPTQASPWAASSCDLCRSRAEWVEMRRLYVIPEARRLGVGRTLVEASEAWARSTGYRRLRLVTLPHMDQAMRALRAARVQGRRALPAFHRR